MIHSCTHHSSPEEEVVLVQVELLSSLHDLGTHLEGEEELVLLKEAPAGVLVYGVGVEVVEVAYPLLQPGVLQGLVYGVTEQLYVGVQGELVHGVYPTHVVHHKEQEGGTLSTRPVALETEHYASHKLSNLNSVTFFTVFLKQATNSI